MGRTKANTKKYNLNISCEGEPLHDGEYCSLREISDYLNLPYNVITNVYEGRRNSFKRWEECKFFPTIRISNLKDTDEED